MELEGEPTPPSPERKHSGCAPGEKSGEAEGTNV
jgi:hypothetical protein